MYLICRVPPHDHYTKRSRKFMGGSSWYYIITLISLVTKSIVIVEMFSICQVTTVSTGLKDYVNLWVKASHGQSPPCNAGGNCSNASGDIKYLISHVTSHRETL